MSAAFEAAVAEAFPGAAATVDWFHVVQLFTPESIGAVDEVRRAEAKDRKMPKHARWATLKANERLTEKQKQALAELETAGLATATAYRAKELLRWVREATTVRGAKWRLTHFIRHAQDGLASADAVLDPVRTALQTVVEHADKIIERWNSNHSNARLEGLNGLFQAARARARGYRNETTFATMIYLIAAPLGDILLST